jgi:hypothetical protein
MDAFVDEAAARSALSALERRLDPADPEAAGVRVLAYGEISAALTVDDPALAGVVAKRMAGFRDEPQADRYRDLVADYIRRLTALGVAVVPTRVEPVLRPGRGPVVYLLQPRLPAQSLGNRLIVDADDDGLRAAIRAVLGRVGVLLDRNKTHPDDEIAVDAQLSNWSFADPDHPTLLDVGTPFLRRGRRHVFDAEIVLSAVPPVLRAYYRWRVADAYMDDYFSARHLCLDLLGNFAKEGAAARTSSGVTEANRWLRGRAEEPITAGDVADYYRRDAAQLELFLKVRRADRFIRRKLGRRYDFILPGPVER